MCEKLKQQTKKMQNAKNLGLVPAAGPQQREHQLARRPSKSRSDVWELYLGNGMNLRDNDEILMLCKLCKYK